tara:strand:+ start:789 stop:983 length:195 start_codon:yes stop_codon:yes gene_type:complete
MKTPSISLKRSLDVTMKDILLKINESCDRDSQALREEYKEWLEASEEGKQHPHVLYINNIKINN